MIIIGGGPGGSSAALWCAELGLKAVLFEKEAEFGGQLLWTFNAIDNYLGVSAANGRELRNRFLQHIEKITIRRFTDSPVASADLTKKTVTLADGSTHSARSIIIATGVRRRKLEVPGEAEFTGRGILRSGVEAKNDVAGKTVVIVGGGDAALENALILSKTAKKVIVVHRRRSFTARPDFEKRAGGTRNIEFCIDTEVTAIGGNGSVESVEVRNTLSGERSAIAADAVLVRIGVVPNTEMFREQLSLDNSGYIVIDSLCSTGVDNVFAVGDVANPTSPTIATAAGQGATAVKTIARMLSTESE